MVTFNRHQDWAFLCAIRVSIPRALREHAESSIGLAPRGRMSVLFSDEGGVSQRPKLFISAVCAVQFSVLFPLSRQMAIGSCLGRQIRGKALQQRDATRRPGWQWSSVLKQEHLSGCDREKQRDNNGKNCPLMDGEIHE